MANDMVVALARATQDKHAYFAHDNNLARGTASSLALVPGCSFSPGDELALTFISLPQIRHTFTVLAGRHGLDTGYSYGVNEKGVAIGCTAIHTRLVTDEPGLLGSELVRLALERAADARHAVDVLTSLIEHHGQGVFPGSANDSAFLVADGREAYQLEAAGRHWALSHVGSVRAMSGVCLLRQDWDRLSHGLSDLAILQQWCPEDGFKLNFAGSLGSFSPANHAAMRRWGQALLRLEQHHGQIDLNYVRRLMGDLAEMYSPLEAARTESQTNSSMVVRWSPRTDEMPVIWCAMGSPEASVYLPIFVLPGLPSAFTDTTGRGCKLWQVLQHCQQECRQDRQLRSALRTGVVGLQQSLDEQLHEWLPNANELYRRGQKEMLMRRASQFMQQCSSAVEEWCLRLGGRAEQSGDKEAEELVGATF